MCLSRHVPSKYRPSAWTLHDDDGRHGQLPALAASASRFKQLDGISVGILDLNLPTTGTGFHLVAKPKSCRPQFRDQPWQIGHSQDHSIPAAWLLLLSVRHRARAGRARTAEQDLRITERQ